MKLVRSLVLWGFLLAALAPSGASAASFNFFSSPGGLGPSENGGVKGPANKYPSSIEVDGLDGDLTKVTATMIDFLAGRPDDIDMLLVSPEGDSVMLMSDACGEASFSPAQTWTFDDDAPSTLTDSGPCSVTAPASFKPSDFVGNPPEPDQFGVGGIIFPPFPTTLATFAGTDPNGPWDLYVKDDEEGVVGFGITSWELTLTVEPPPQPAEPPAPPAPPDSTPGGGQSAPTTQSTTTTQSAPPATGVAEQGKTGKRAAALAKCKLKKTKAKRAHCRAKARKLPV